VQLDLDEQLSALGCQYQQALDARKDLPMADEAVAILEKFQPQIEDLLSLVSSMLKIILPSMVIRMTYS
jgi:hypothetical protein